MFKRIFKKVLIGVAVLAVGLVGVAIHVSRTWDRSYDAPLPEVHASTAPEVLARGEYLVYGPAHCVACHTSSYSDMAKLARGTKVPLSGGLRLSAAPLGDIYSRNLTPDPETGIGRYSDGQIARMMRWSVRPDGRATIEPMMPFGNMSDDDVNAIISYLRSMPPVKNAVPTNEWTIPGKVVRTFFNIMKPRTAIHPASATPAGVGAARGEYLARSVANCVGCHTKRDEATFVATGTEFAGGWQLEPDPNPGADLALWFISPNLTPMKGSALLKFPNREAFITRFRSGRVYAGSPMPWEAFARMSTEDLESLYEFLHRLPPSAGPSGQATFKKGS
ncbi:MAG: cytochrome c [Gemmatimonadota bacterium]